MPIYIFAALALAALAQAAPNNDTASHTIDPNIQQCIDSSLNDRDILQAAIDSAREELSSAALNASAPDYPQTTETDSSTWEEDFGMLEDYSPSEVEVAQLKIDHVNQMVAKFYEGAYPGAENRKTRYLTLKSIMLELDLMSNDRMRARATASNAEVNAKIAVMGRSLVSCYATLIDCYEKEGCRL